jgi:DNA mismatch endonuclease, patch repair protein
MALSVPAIRHCLIKTADTFAALAGCSAALARARETGTQGRPSLVMLDTQSMHAAASDHPSIVPLVAWQKESWASSDRVRSVMRGNRSRDTRPELAIRSAVHRLGLRYRVCVRPVEGFRRSADIVFRGARVAVFVDGCFWHGCPEHYVPSLSNRDYWDEKIQRNRARDQDTNRRLADEGWVPLRIWAHEDPQVAARLIAETVRRIATEQRRLRG